MGGFWTGVGSGLEQYGQNRMKRHHGLGNAVMQGVQNQQQQGGAFDPVNDPNGFDRQMADQSANGPAMAPPDPSGMSGADDSMSGGAPSMPVPPPPPPNPPQPMQAFDDGPSPHGSGVLGMGKGGDDGMGGGDDMAALEAFSGGKIVTHPTTALIGENGPEAVIPLNPQPGAKITPGMMGLNTPTPGLTGTKTRTQKVSGPNAMKHTAPIRHDLPLKPNVIAR